AAPARRLARAVARSPEDAREDVRLPVDHVGVGVATLRDQADVFGNGRVGGTRPLAIDDLVEVGRIRGVGALQSGVSSALGALSPRQPVYACAASNLPPGIPGGEAQP